MVGIPFWPALFFWPAIAVGLAASCVGLRGRRPSWLVGAAVLMLPASLYLAAMPRLQFFGTLPFVFLLDLS